jgi:tRNA-splicing ligase RtcB (3'-phosphate/5'-hydroxy nucleic acid ligase)
MGKQKLTIKDLAVINFSSEVAKSLALNIMNRHFKHTPNEEKITIIKELLAAPSQYVDHHLLGGLTKKLISKKGDGPYTSYELEDKPKAFNVVGTKHIEDAAIKQMEIAMRLPVSVSGALMPDAHPGYGLPIGGVLATRSEVIPYAVGMDIGCRMALSILDLPASYIDHNGHKLKNVLRDLTHFGNEGGLEIRQEHEILDHSLFRESDLLRKLHGKAIRQLGSSGSGNHFVEFGIVELTDGNALGLLQGTYSAILSHSGSRSLGANIAQHFTSIAMDKCKLPKEAKQLAWLDVESDAGSEYWLSMNLAAEYAKACHDRIHENLCNALGITVLMKVENHHNLAWKELQEDGQECIVHRKGATPAGLGVVGIIPGSMTTPGFIVSGLGNERSLLSASHGAGRAMSRHKAKTSITVSSMHKTVKAAKVTLIGGSTEEAPSAYKNIDSVMKSQEDLVTIEGKFYPRIVRMANE